MADEPTPAADTPPIEPAPPVTETETPPVADTGADAPTARELELMSEAKKYRQDKAAAKQEAEQARTELEAARAELERYGAVRKAFLGEDTEEGSQPDPAQIAAQAEALQREVQELRTTAAIEKTATALGADGELVAAWLGQRGQLAGVDITDTEALTELVRTATTAKPGLLLRSGNISNGNFDETPGKDLGSMSEAEYMEATGRRRPFARR